MELIFLAVGIGIGYLIFRPKKTEEEKPSLFESEEEPELGPMTLRHGYGVTREEKPTFAEQWMNIINFNGENQKEGDYE